MKRYFALIGIALFTLIVTVSLFVFLIGDRNSYITYIKIQVNPSFVIGINDDYKVVFYNSLNADGNKYNLEMFQGKTLNDSIKIFMDKLGEAHPEKNEINLTVMTKDDSKEKRINEIIFDAISEYDNNYIIVTHEPLPEELERYSNETIYNVDASFKQEELKSIGKTIYDKVFSYVEEKFKDLKLEELSDEEKIDLIKLKQEEGYFNDLVINNMKLDISDTTILERTAYTVEIDFHSDFSYEYKIILNLEIEHLKYELKKIIEVYQYDYTQGEDIEIVSNLKKYFYTF